MQNTYTIVSDPGIDDIVALFLLCALAPRGTHTLVSTFGNAPERYTGKNAREFIYQKARHWKYVRGAQSPQRPLECPWPDYFHGPDGLWGVHPKVSGKARPLKRIPENKKIISLGPMTNIIDIMRYTTPPEEIVIMGGAFEVPGNETPYSETNIRFDPDAGAEFFQKHTANKKVKVVPLDVTRKVYWNEGDIKKMSARDPSTRWLKKILLTWFQRNNSHHEKNFALHDPLAVYIEFFPESVKWKRSGIRVVKRGEQRGRTLFSKNNPPCKIALDVYDPQKIAKHIQKLITKSA